MRKSRRTFLLTALATVASCAAILTFAVPEGNPISSVALLGRDPVRVAIFSSVTKQRWVEDAAERFEAAGVRTGSGAPIDIEVTPVLSGDSMLQIVDGTLQPTVWSPGESAWVDQLDERWGHANPAPIHSKPCESTVLTPVGFAMWRPMAEALGWPSKPIGWKTLVDLANDPDGWASHGHPEWGALRLGHTHPQYSSAGLLFLASVIYAQLGITSGLTTEAVYSKPVTDALTKLAKNTSKYGMVTTDLLSKMASGGPEFLHVSAAFEEGTVRFNREHADELRWPLVFVFPEEGTFWSDHPYCILDQSGWVKPEESEAAQLFLDFLLSGETQAAAESFFVRPLSDAVALGSSLSNENGTDPTASPRRIPALKLPNPEVSEAIIDQFMSTKRKATTMIVLDTSGSMNGERIQTATAATAAFLSRFDPQDRIGLITFNDQITKVSSVLPASDNSERLQSVVENLVAGGGTDLNGAICRAAEEMRKEVAEDVSQGENRVYGIVLLSDGADSMGKVSDTRMFIECLKTDAETEGVKVFAISFGDEAPADVLVRLADETHGALFRATPDSIDATYLKISAEQ
jgi:Ca-activated chloride channel family protein